MEQFKRGRTHPENEEFEAFERVTLLLLSKYFELFFQ